MEQKALNVIIVGGSIAGLMHGIMIKRLGHNVRILEQHASPSRESHAAGIAVGPQVQEVLNKIEVPLKTISFHSPGLQILDKNLNVKRFISQPVHLTGWNVLHSLLRAHFDQYTVRECPQATPESDRDDREAVYDHGKRVTDLVLSQDSIRVVFEDLINGGSGELAADMVIAADGARSTIRELFSPDLPNNYAGYLAWRGVVAEKDVSENTRETLGRNTNVFASNESRSYIVVYIIPGENGSLEVGERLLNFIWYCNCPLESREFQEAMTDVDGHTHRNTLPSGKMCSDIWARQRAYGNEILPAPFAELINAITRPFITAIGDVSSPQASFFDGKVLLVGDAVTLIRPHLAKSTNQAALHCLLLEKYLKGEMRILEWEKQVLQYARANKFLSIAVADFYLSGLMGFLFSILRYILAVMLSI